MFSQRSHLTKKYGAGGLPVPAESRLPSGREEPMYSVVLLTAMASVAPGTYAYPDVAGAPYLCCPQVCGCCGVIIPYWSLGEVGPSLSVGAHMQWQDYLDLLDEPDRSE